MSQRRSSHGRPIAWWASVACRHAMLVVFLATALTAFLAWYAATHLGINTDTVDMLSEELSWRVDHESYKRAFPRQRHNIVVVIDAATPELAADAQRELGARLTGSPELFEDLYLPGGGEFFERNALLYADVDQLELLADRLRTVAPWLIELERDPTLPRFVAVLDSLMATPDEREEVAPLLGAVGNAFAQATRGAASPLPWQELLAGGEAAPEAKRRFIIALPRLDYEELLPGSAAMDRIAASAADLGLVAERGVRVRITGAVAMADDELRSALKGSGIALVVALLLVTGILYAGLRSFRLMAASVATLLVGLVCTAAFAALAVGNLNLVSIAFAVLYVGLGVDYAIHFSLRYRDLRLSGADNQAAVRETAEDVGGSLFLSAVTTAACFYAFVPTAFKGLSELGVIAGTGMFVSLLVTITVLPAILALLPLRPTERESAIGVSRLPARFGIAVSRHHRAVLAGAAVVGLACLALVPRIRFDPNPLNLRDAEMESVSTFHELMADSGSSPMTIAVMRPDLGSARELAEELERLQTVEAVIGLDDFLPADQQVKWSFIARIDSILGPPDAADALRTDPGVQGRLEAVERLRRTAQRLAVSDSGEAAAVGTYLAFQIRAWQRWLEGRSPLAVQVALERLEESLLAGLRLSLRSLRTAMLGAPFETVDLPTDVAEWWVNPDGVYRLEVVPREDLTDNAAMRRFVEEVQTVAPRATGDPVINVGAGDAVVRAFRQALVSAVIATFVLLFLMLRSFSSAIRVLIPLLLAGALTGAASVIFDQPFNYANIIALPLLLGVGVDNGIHMIHRSRASQRGVPELLSSSTARAVLYSALTTIFSFGNLAFSSHPGTASMGRLLTIGMLSVLLCTLVVLPALEATSARGEAAG